MSKFELFLLLFVGKDPWNFEVDPWNFVLKVTDHVLAVIVLKKIAVYFPSDHQTFAVF